jgi:hypothetical protein
MFIAEKYVKKRVINGSYVPRFIDFQGHWVKFLGEGICHALRCPRYFLIFFSVDRFTVFGTYVFKSKL